ncbi:MAG TPA: type II toxin-antitoxin system HicB family antitoxin [Solirubrobacteraceae bacterium]|nr:type II toxin-antitoxin system HicB family antitoxin [Solirubrobacteraceae bacterium]
MTVQEVEAPTTTDEITETDCEPTSTASSPVPKPVITFFATVRKIFGRPEDKRERHHEPPAISESGMWKMLIQVEQDELDGGFIAETPDVPGAMAQGETEKEAVENLGDAIASIVQAKLDEQFEAMDLPDGGVRSFKVILS